MNLRTTLIICAIILCIFFVGCAKKEEEPPAEETTEAPVLPTITDKSIDEFIKTYPTIQQSFETRRDELAQIDKDSPVAGSMSNRLMDEIEDELRDKGVDVEYFFGLYQKIAISATYIRARQDVENMDPVLVQSKIEQLEVVLEDSSITDEQKGQINQAITELKAQKEIAKQRQTQIEQLRAALEDPQTPEEEKAQIRMALENVEAMKNQATMLPEGLTEEELAVIQRRLNELVALFQGPAQPTTEPQQADTTN